MKETEYFKILRDKPRYVPIFKLVKVPAWCNQFSSTTLEKGDELFVDKWGGLRPVNKSGCYGIGASYLKFVEYRLADHHMRNFLI